jgi:hypothetical protein
MFVDSPCFMTARTAFRATGRAALLPLPYDFRNDPILGRAFQYWQGKCGERPMPRRSDINPSEITRLLPYLQITEHVAGSERIRYRLVGTAIGAAYGAELTGKCFDEVFSGDRLSFIENNYRMMEHEKRPVLTGSHYVSRKIVELFCYRIVMPLSEDGATVNQALTAMSFKYPDETSRPSGQWFRDSDALDLATSFCEVIR